MNLDEIVDRLDKHRQRATYGAVAALLDRPARWLMQGREPSRRYSWVVSKGSHEPTNYTSEQMHPELKRRQIVIEDAGSLQDGLRSHA